MLLYNQIYVVFAFAEICSQNSNDIKISLYVALISCIFAFLSILFVFKHIYGAPQVCRLNGLIDRKKNNQYQVNRSSIVRKNA